jgi:acyl-CoA thioesterase-1
VLILLVSTQASATTILVLGDSLSAGYGIRQEEAWPELLARRLNSTTRTSPTRYRVINASISGETTAGGLSRTGELLRQHRPDIVVIELGANDGLRGLSLNAMRRNLVAIIEQTRTANARPVLIGMQLPPNYGNYAEQFQATYSDLAQTTRTPFVPFLLAGLNDQTLHFQPDGLHPTRDAQTIILDNVWPTLRPMLKLPERTPSAKG